MQSIAHLLIVALMQLIRGSRWFPCKSWLYVKKIPAFAFDGLRGVRTIIIPDSVEYVGDGAFHSCDSLESLVIGNSVDSIGGGAFYGCTGLTSITAKPMVEMAFSAISISLRPSLPRMQMK